MRKIESMTEGSIYRLIRDISIPASTGLIFTTLYNVVDTYFAGQKVGTDALAGITLSFPIFFIIIAISSGLGAATTALLSISLGNDDHKKYHKLIFNSLLIAIVLAIILIFINPFSTPRLLKFAGGTEGTLKEGLAYVDTLFYGSLFFLLNSVFNGILNSQGDTKSYRNFLIIGFFMNLVLDPLFVMGWGGFPEMGSKGVALSTVIIMGTGSVYLAIRVIKSKNFDLKIFKKESLNFESIKELTSQAIPSTLNTATIAIGVFVVNYYILKISGKALTLAAYGAAMRIEQLILIPTMGLNTAALTITGQNFGAKKYERVSELQKKIVFLGFGIIAVLSLVIYPFVGVLISIFNNDVEVIKAGVTYLRIGLLAEPTYVLISLYISILQGIKKPSFSIFIGLYRQLIMPFLFISLLCGVFKMDIRGVWWSIFLVNWSAAGITYLYSRHTINKVLSP